jgi:non-canonical purine NTP pyrophosphatase (RdgB/HAM1 family)
MTHNQTLTLVTGNPGKLKEWKRLLPSEFTLETADIDLDEIQSMDLMAIIEDKARRAYERIGTPVLVEDVSAGLVKLGGMPGPFIKYFELSMGLDALFKLADKAGDSAIVTCTVAYFDGARLIAAEGSTVGTVVPPRGKNGFGFDAVFVPNGGTRTYGEMTPHEKDIISHRGKAIKALVDQLNKNI